MKSLELKKYIKENYEKERHLSFKQLINNYDEEEFCEDKCLIRECASSLNHYIDENNTYNVFQTMLFKLIDDRNLNDADVYNKVHIDRRLFSKIRNDKDYHPSRETVILLGLSLELNEGEIEDLLQSASYYLPKNNYYDLIIRYCFVKGIYNLSEVNKLLSEYKCKLFSY